MDEDDFASKLSSFSISTNEEKLTHQLNTTHITSASTIPSIFATNTPNNNSANPAHAPSGFHSILSFSRGAEEGNYNDAIRTTATTHQSNNSNKPWDGQNSWTEKQHKGAEEGEDGWGHAPAATAVFSDTLFGFSSIMEAPEFVRKAQLANTATYDRSCHAAQTAFQEYRNRPVSFTSAAAEVAAAANNNKQRQQQQQHL